MNELQIGSSARAERRVEQCDLVPAFADRFSSWANVPSVAASIILIGLMEEACVRAVTPFLKPAQTTLGGQIDFSHFAPTPIGGLLRATANLIEISGGRLVFDATCHDDVELVGRMRHTRSIVDRANFESRVRSKLS